MDDLYLADAAMEDTCFLDLTEEDHAAMRDEVDEFVFSFEALFQTDEDSESF